MKKLNTTIILLMITILICGACGNTNTVQASESVISNSSPADLTVAETSEIESSQENSADDPDYDLVFPQDGVNEITITISPDNWSLMMDDMTDLYGEKGISQRAGPAENQSQPPQIGQRDKPLPGNIQGGAKVDNRPGMAMKGGNDDQNPTWVEAEITFNGESWEHVGIRFKGNSSLKSIWGSDSYKLPFKLDFDEFEDEYPETEDQRFYGFKQISFSANFHDDSLLREKIAADLFREAGIVSAQTAFYAVSIDYGEGPVYIGLYTAVEVVDDTVIETQFSDDSGNVYKPEGAGASFTAGSFSEASFDKETNQDEDDYSDILVLFDTLHDQSRMTDPESWRQNLESIFDVDTFLNWLAVNTIIQNWDVYGAIGHNYYLYNDPDSGQLVWIPWDHNESLKSKQGMRPSASFGLDEYSDDWPLISYLRDDPIYYQRYLEYMESFLDEVFTINQLEERLEAYHDLISPYVMDEDPSFTLVQSPAAFERSVDDLMQHIRLRITAAESFLEEQ